MRGVPSTKAHVQGGTSLKDLFMSQLKEAQWVEGGLAKPRGAKHNQKYRHGVLAEEKMEQFGKEKSSFHDQRHQQAAEGKKDDEEFGKVVSIAGNPVKEILLKLNLPDHWLILTDSKVTPTNHRGMTNPYLSPCFIANCFISGIFKDGDGGRLGFVGLKCDEGYRLAIGFVIVSDDVMM
ncbi:hypothetical protein Tco_1335916 [Tanacetum coccineum]